jgi:O-6-methylguanine DNA methyltransferase
MTMTIDLEVQLRRLGDVRAPANLRSRVLAQVGLGDEYAPVETPIGVVYVAHNRDGISAVMRAASAEEFERWFEGRFRRPLRPAGQLPEELAHRLAAALSGGRAKFDFDLRSLSDFERAVLAKTLEIPRGEVRTYAWIAREIGRPGAVRAVGTALGHNPVPLLIPCHRVVRSDGWIGEYSGGGPEAKRAILSHEGVSPEELERLARTGTRYLGSRTTGIYCFPTCRAARRISEPNRVELRSEAQATAEGYRPCRLCRPALAS